MAATARSMLGLLLCHESSAAAAPRGQIISVFEELA